MVLRVQRCLGGFGNLDEVSNVLTVGEVGVDVVLEVLDEVHLLLDEIVSSDSWECEGTVIEFPGVNRDSWFDASFFEQTIVDFQGVIVVNHVEAS